MGDWGAELSIAVACFKPACTSVRICGRISRKEGGRLGEWTGLWARLGRSRPRDSMIRFNSNGRVLVHVHNSARRFGGKMPSRLSLRRISPYSSKDIRLSRRLASCRDRETRSVHGWPLSPFPSLPFPPSLVRQRPCSRRPKAAMCPLVAVLLQII
ncbi:hypothetical protein GQ53DRAFT_376146 [Thozetella sp. PMI_491]|nr:hypothetical protein GQ53DRAFT_376146 [Thozetella sp. PMI_491]